MMNIRNDSSHKTIGMLAVTLASLGLLVLHVFVDVADRDFVILDDGRDVRAPFSGCRGGACVDRVRGEIARIAAGQDE